MTLKLVDIEEIEPRKRNKYTDEELLKYPRKFYLEKGREPKRRDFENDSNYPGSTIYRRRFGSWENALKLVGMDTESLVKKGFLDTVQQKGRHAELLVRYHFKKNPIDLAGENRSSPCDGICPNGKSYEVKSAGFRTSHKSWHFQIENKYKNKFEIIYLLAFDVDYKELIYAWRILGEMVLEKEYFIIGLSMRHEHNIENMKKYEITDKIKEVIKKEE